MIGLSCKNYSLGLQKLVKLAMPVDLVQVVHSLEGFLVRNTGLLGASLPMFPPHQGITNSQIACTCCSFQLTLTRSTWGLTLNSAYYAYECKLHVKLESKTSLTKVESCC